MKTICTYVDSVNRIQFNIAILEQNSWRKKKRNQTCLKQPRRWIWNFHYLALSWFFSMVLRALVKPPCSWLCHNKPLSTWKTSGWNRKGRVVSLHEQDNNGGEQASGQSRLIRQHLNVVLLVWFVLLWSISVSKSRHHRLAGYKIQITSRNIFQIPSSIKSKYQNQMSQWAITR